MVMDLNAFQSFSSLDPQNMANEIDHLPDQLQSAWELGQELPLPDGEPVSRTVITGMGGSAIGADLLAAYIAPYCRMPVVVSRDYNLPAWARGKETMVIVSSHSGNTEETLSAFEEAQNRGCQMLAVCTGGELEKRAGQAGIPVWKFAHLGQPRAAVGFSFGLLLSAFARLGWIPDPVNELKGTVAAMRQQQEGLRISVPVVKNSAKRQAGQLVGRWVNVFASGMLSPVARRWKGQINELAKAGAGFECLPEGDHNTLAGTLNPPETITRTISLFLRAPADHPRNRQRLDLTCQAFMLEGLTTDFYDARGDTPLAQMWTALHFGDYMAYYLAMLYEIDPTPVAALENFKNAMKSVK